MSSLKIRKPAWKWVNVRRVIKLRWTAAPDTKGIAELPCTACGNEVGYHRIGIAWVDDGDTERGMRLCVSCGLKAEADMEKSSEPQEAKGRMGS